MQISNITCRMTALPCSGEPWLPAVAACLRDHLPPDAYPLRFAIVEVSPEGATLEVTVVRERAPETSPYAEQLSTIEFFSPRRKTAGARPFCAVQIIPTGLGCEIGGYAGDACPATNLLAAAVDVLITHPNSVNASELNEMAANVLYVEGKSLDDFLLGHLGLLPVTANRIGTFIDPAGSNYLDDVVSTLNAARASAGIDCGLYALVPEPLDVAVEWSKAGCAVGTIRSAAAMVSTVDALILNGAEAIGGVSVIHGVTAEMAEHHLRGKIPNPSGGVEAIITHLISKLFRVPTAHAPLPYYRALKPKKTDNPRAAAEFISTPHYFSVLKGLSRAPRLMQLSSLDRRDVPDGTLTLNNVGAVIMPAGCLGGVPALVAELSRIPLIAVHDNASILTVTNELMRMPNVIEVGSYAEAAGILLAIRSGISIESLHRPLNPPRRIEV